jgi:hypothetical protein
MQSIRVALNEHGLVDVGKPADDAAACPAASNDEHPHLTIQQFFVQFVGLHVSVAPLRRLFVGYESAGLI